MSSETSGNGSSAPRPHDLLVDPETDVTATYAVEPGLARTLTARVVCAPRPEWTTTVTPMTGGPVASLPLSTADDVTLAVTAARAAQRAWARTTIAARAAIFLRFHDLVLRPPGRDPRPDPAGVRQGPQARVRRARSTSRDLRPPLRPHGPALPAAAAAAGAFPVLTQASRCSQPKGVVGIISPWNYPFDLALTTSPGPDRRQRRRPEPGRPDLADRALRAAAARPRPACPRASCRS